MVLKASKFYLEVLGSQNLKEFEESLEIFVELFYLVIFFQGWKLCTGHVMAVIEFHSNVAD